MATGDITTIDRIILAGRIPDGRDNLWLASAISGVSAAIETLTGRWLSPRPAASYLFDSDAVSDTGDVLWLPMGVGPVTYLGIAWTDQPDDGTGSYTSVPLAYVYPQPPVQQRNDLGDPATAVEIGRQAGIWFPPRDVRVRRCVKVTASSWGWAVSPGRPQMIAENAILAAWRARDNASSAGGVQGTVVVGPGGGMTILREFAPAAVEELIGMYRDPVVG